MGDAVNQPASRRTGNAECRDRQTLRLSTVMLTSFFGISSLLYFGWEMAQMPLFELAGFTFWQSVWMCLYATATGDLLFMTVIYAMLALAHRDFWWIAKRTSYIHPATWVQTPVIDLLLAASFEMWAIYIERRWSYGSMPMIPVLRIGWTPMLQMIIVPLVTLACCAYLAAKLWRQP